MPLRIPEGLHFFTRLSVFEKKENRNTEKFVDQKARAYTILRQLE